jgi:Uma2 family endonuclease
MTAEDLLHLPDDGFRFELVRGELHKRAPAGGNHGAIAMNLAGPLHQFVQANNLGKVFAAETGFLISRDPDTVRAPDIAFVRRERA